MYIYIYIIIIIIIFFFFFCRMLLYAFVTNFLYIKLAIKPCGGWVFLLIARDAVYVILKLGLLFLRS